LLTFSSRPIRHVSVTGYVLNEDRTKLLMRYHERLDQWLPATGKLKDSELPHEAVVREVYEGTGLAATPLDVEASQILDPVDGRRQAPRPYVVSPDHHVYVLEASEDSVSPYDLEEHYDAQWLDRDELLRCRTIAEDARSFAAENLRRLTTV
jgi:8-oxo-dGTP pyrophosphatase MutT (NUDIX family)